MKQPTTPVSLNWDGFIRWSDPSIATADNQPRTLTLDNHHIQYRPSPCMSSVVITFCSPNHGRQRGNAR